MKSLSLKKRTDEYRFFFVLFLFCSLLFLSACSESQVELEEKLDFTLQDDLKWIVGEVMRGTGKKHLLEKPYYVLEDLRYFEGDTARVFSAYAKVKYYYFKDIAIVQERKYRYQAQNNFWDRYYKKLLHEAPKD